MIRRPLSIIKMDLADMLRVRCDKAASTSSACSSTSLRLSPPFFLFR